MSDLIDRQAAIDAIRDHKRNVLGQREWDEGIAFGYSAAHEHICDIIKTLPTIAERKKGKWMGENTRSASYIFKCSCCGKNAYFVHGKGRGRNCENRYCGYDYCPNCGADMRGDADETD